MSDELDEVGDFDRGYEVGQKAAYATLLSECIAKLGVEGDAHRWRIERAETVAKLRELCGAAGDNDWDDDLHLADVIEKHLFRHFEVDE